MAASKRILVIWPLIALMALTTLAVGCSAFPPPYQHADLVRQHDEVTEIVRSRVESDLAQPVEFGALEVGMSARFAGVRAVPLGQDGAPIDFSRIPKYAPTVAAGSFDTQVYALLEKSDGKWRLIEYEIGDKGHPDSNWLAKHGAPQGLF